MLKKCCFFFFIFQENIEAEGSKGLKDSLKTVEQKVAEVSLTFSALKTKINTFANCVDRDETAHNEPSHLDLHYLQFCC